MVARGLGYLPYFLTLKTLQEAVKGRGLGGVELWARNSYALGYLAPGRSDLDLTAWFEEEPSRDQFLACAERLARARRWAPWIGEVNWYARPSALALASFMNPHELDRDPVLRERLRVLAERKVSDSALGLARSAAFLLRMLEADARGVVQTPEKRERKWRHHLKAIEAATGIRAPAPSSPDLLSQLLVYAGGIANLPLSELRPYIEGCARRDHLPTRAISSLWQASFPNRFCFIESESPWEPAASRLAIAQTEWEIWGIYSQFRAFPGPSEPQNTIEHLQRIGRMASRMLQAGPDRERLASGLEELAGVISRNS